MAVGKEAICDLDSAQSGIVVCLFPSASSASSAVTFFSLSLSSFVFFVPFVFQTRISMVYRLVHRFTATDTDAGSATTGAATAGAAR
jgi:hypothetical protein